jgi:hypothetical protein
VSFKSWTDVIGALVIVALVTTLVAHQQTAAIVSSLGQSFSGALTAAQGGTAVNTQGIFATKGAGVS